MKHSIHAVFFDLDGTLADTAKDLAVALNVVLEQAKQTPLPFEVIRPWVSHGARHMICQAFACDDQDEYLEIRWQTLVDYYQTNIAVHTDLFAGMETVLEELEREALPWGIVTNKPTALTTPLVEALGLQQRSACTVCSDTLVARKPHPLPLLYASQEVDIDPKNILYVGDAQRDIEAGQRANMQTAAALFGYLGTEDKPETWGADQLVSHPEALLEYIFN